MSHAPTSQHLSNLPCASNIVQSLTQGDMYLEVIEETNNQMLAPRTKINGDKYHVSSPREERNFARLIFKTKNEKDDKCNTINKKFPVTIERNNFAKQALTPYHCRLLLLQNSLQAKPHKKEIKKQANIQTNICL